MISEEIVLQIKSATRIEDVIGEYVALKREGVNLKGLCPFHNEETGSFTVSPAKDIYYCFGCRKGGDVFNFIMEHEHVSFPIAVKMIAKKCHIDVPERELSPEELATLKKRENALTALDKQNSEFKNAISKNGAALLWLTKERKITPESIEKWGLGFAVSGFFGGRITYPIHNGVGEILGFTGRRLKDDLLPKFKNSAEDDLFKKSMLLYGLHQAKMKINKIDRCYFTEGQHDVIMMHQLGFENTVCGSGTSLTIQQINLIKPWTKNIVLLLDADKAGTAAVLKHISTLLTEQINLRIVVLPDGEDPDSFIRKKDPDFAQQYIMNNEIDFIEFKASKLKKEIETDPTRKGELITEITNDISLIHDKNVRLAYIQRCASIFGIKETELAKDIFHLREKMKTNSEEGIFFALEEAKISIVEENEVHILTKNEDVIDYHLNDNKNYIGMNGAPVQKSEILKLKKLTKKVIFDEILDSAFNDRNMKETPAVRNLKRFILFGLDVRIKTEERGVIDEEIGDYNVNIDYINFPDWYIACVTKEISPADDVFMSKAINSLAELISYLPEGLRVIKINNTTTAFKKKGMKLGIGDFKKIISGYSKKNAKSFEPNNEPANYTVENQLDLNQEQLNDLNHYQHYYKNSSIYHVSGGSIQKISNFVIIPIIHSNTSGAHFKLFEMTNEFGLKVSISLDTKDLNDVRRFKCAVEEKGNYVFKGDQRQLDNIKERLYSNTIYCNEIEQLGWQPEGFWAWANGVTTLDGKFTNTDSNGLITIGDKNYLIKPFSNLYANDKTAYLCEKKFLHLTSEFTFEDWSYRYRNVFGDNTMICICALLTALFSDVIFKLVHGELPLINFFGPKGTGKTQMADCLLAFFGEKQPINNLSKVTVYGLSQTLKSFHNSLCLIDEYKNILDIKFIELLKSIYNRQAKIHGSYAPNGSKTEHIPINQMALLCGQELPTQDVALLERCLCLTSFKSEYTDDQKTRYNELKSIEEKGLAHLLDDFLKYREEIIERFTETNSMIQTKISNLCPHVSVRLQKNLSTILTSFCILEDKFNFPFTFDEVLKFGTQVISEQQKFIESSDDIKNFWTIFATLIEQKKIKEGRNYLLHDIIRNKYVGCENPVTYGSGKMTLFIRWDGLYPLYAEFSNRSKMTVLSEKTIQFYLEKSSSFLGKIKNKKFRDKEANQEWNNQAYCFDYDLIDISLIPTLTDDIELNNSDMSPMLDHDDFDEIKKNNPDDNDMERLPF